MLRTGAVPLALKRLERRNQRHRGFDRIRALACFAHMNRPASHMNPEPDHPGIGPHQHVLFGLRDEGGICPIPPDQRRQCSVTGALFFRYRLQMDACGGLPPQGFERIKGCQVSAKTRLHIGAAPAIKPVTFDPGFKRRACPHVHGPCRHHIYVAVEDQGPAFSFLRRMRTDHIDRIVVVDLDGGEPRVTFNLGNIDGPLVHLITAKIKCLEKTRLGLMLITTGGIQSHHLLGERQLLLKPLINSIQYLLGQLRR